MQLDRPAKRRPRHNQDRPTDTDRNSERPPSSGFAGSNPFSQRPHPFSASQSTQADPFLPRNAAAGPRRNSNRTAPFSSQSGAPSAASDPFQPLRDHGTRRASGRRYEQAGSRQNQNTFGQSSAPFGQGASSFPLSGDPFAQNAKPFGSNAPSFGRNHTSFGPSGVQRSPAQAQEAPAAAFTRNVTNFRQPEVATPDPDTSTFGQDGTSFGQKAAPFGQNSTSFGQTSTAFDQDGTSFGQSATAFGHNTTSFGQNTTSFARNAPSVRQEVTPFAHHTKSFDHGETSVRETQDPFSQGTQAPQRLYRAPAGRRRGGRSGRFSQSMNERTSGALFPGPDHGESDIDTEKAHGALSPTSGIDRKKAPIAKAKQLFLKSVPLPLFSRTALQSHFSNTKGVNATHVSLRGSRRPDSRRTAVIAFASDQDAIRALRGGSSFQGNPLLLSLFRQSSQANDQTAAESNELFFNSVPESLFSEESIKKLFDGRGGGGVTNVNLKERPHFGSVKRTAVITFVSVQAASAALRSLPLYNGRPLTVSFRWTPAGTHGKAAAAAATGTFGDGGDDGMQRESGGREEDRNAEPEEDGPGVPLGHSLANRLGYNSGSLDYERDSDYGELKQGKSEETQRPDKQAEIARLKAAIERKEKERSVLAKTGRDRRERRIVIPKHREAPAADQGSSGSAWRKVGEKVDIKNAASFAGTCLSMCPFKEFEDRILRRDISMFETDGEGEPVFEKAVKKYRRSAAISEQPSPDEVRPPAVLLEAMEYLKNICDSTGATFADIHNFIRDRTRSIRQDYTLQGVRDESCIKIHEESVRFHIMSEHRLYGTDPTVFSSKQNLEQLDKCFISLREMYDLRREKGLNTSPNEPEMQAYYILTQMSDPKTCVQLCTGFAQDVRCSQPVQFALEVVRAAFEGFGSFTKYFSLVRSAPYLMACLLHSRFSAIRIRALLVINETHGNQNSADSIPISRLTRQLGFENDHEAEQFCHTLGMKVEIATIPSLDSKVLALRTPSPSFDETKVSEWKASRADVLIESKSNGIKTSEIITGDDRGDTIATSTGSIVRDKLEGKRPVTNMVSVSIQEPMLRETPQTVERGSTDSRKLTKTLVAPLEKQDPVGERRSALKRTLSDEKAGHTRHELQISKRRTFDAKHSTKTSRVSFKDSTQLPVLPPLPPMNLFGAASPFLPASHFVQPTEMKAAGIFPLTGVKKPRSPAPYPGTRVGLSPRLVPSKEERVRTPKKPLLPAFVQPFEETTASNTKEAPKMVERDEEPAIPKPAQSSYDTGLEAFLTDVVDGSESTYEEVHEIVRDAECGGLRFPKAMEIWDDAKDMLFTASERIREGMLKLDDACAAASLAKRVLPTHLEDVGGKLRSYLHLGTDLLDRLDEVFSKSLSLATAQLRGPQLQRLRASNQTQVKQNRNSLARLAEYGLGEDASFETKVLPDAGAEIESVVTTMCNSVLHRWQAVVASITNSDTTPDDVGIAHRWLRQRLSTPGPQEEGSLCLVDTGKSGCPSVSVREIQTLSRIPYTVDFIIVPCDIRTLSSSTQNAWTSLEMSLSKNRDIARSCQLPPPTLVILYYRGTSDLPSWFTENTATNDSFSSFQRALQEKNLVTTCQKLELPREISSETREFKQFTNKMTASVQSCTSLLGGLRGIPRLSDLRDRLVQVANNVLGSVMESSCPQLDVTVSARIAPAINAAWETFARSLRGEAGRWPEELSHRTRLVTACAHIERYLQLPPLRDDSSITQYVGDLAAVSHVGVAPVEQLVGPFAFCSALGHLMTAFVQEKLKNCPISTIYLPVGSRDEYVVRKQKSTARYLVTPQRARRYDLGPAARYAPQTEPLRKTKRIRDEGPAAVGRRRPRYPLRRRLSTESTDQIATDWQSSDVFTNRRQSLPASYGRRRMYELLDRICSEEKVFVDHLQATMDALTEKRRRLQHRGTDVVAI